MDDEEYDEIHHLEDNIWTWQDYGVHVNLSKGYTRWYTGESFDDKFMRDNKLRW